MAKKLWAKRDPPNVKRELGTIKLSTSEHFPRHIINLSKFKNVMEAIKMKLTRLQLRLFNKDVFGHFAKMNIYVLRGVIMHNGLLRQVTYDECDEHQLWFEFGGQLARLSISEWYLITRLCYGAYNIHILALSIY